MMLVCSVAWFPGAPSEMCIRDRLGHALQMPQVDAVAILEHAVVVIGQRGLEHRADAVSYTHLDVYKRQRVDREAPSGNDFLGNSSLSASLNRLKKRSNT